MLANISLIYIVSWFLVPCVAHPAGQDEINHFQALSTRHLTERTYNGLRQCNASFKKRGFMSCSENRCATLLRSYRQQLGASSVTSSYGDSKTNALLPQPSFDEPTCSLTPESTIGPYWIRGEFIRPNITDGEEGIPLILDGQLILEVWSCNTLGKYSGVGPGSQPNEAFLRGLQKTDKDGSAQFKTIFPGHYAGRATHIHVLAYNGATILPNSTLAGGYIPRIGQLFFDDDLVEAVEASQPYRSNNAPVTRNSENGIFIAARDGGKYNPVVQYAMLGGRLEDGLSVSVTIGIDLSAHYRADYATLKSHSTAQQDEVT
ncbi:Intradiol ring-cleavage dioxygenase [Aspergillus desertorum]